jgi:hypothetical protein
MLNIVRTMRDKYGVSSEVMFLVMIYILFI